MFLFESLIPYLETAAEFGKTWGPLIVFFFMTVESSFIPFPSEIVMLPAGFMAARADFFPASSPWAALFVAIACGIVGSIAGAYVNYFLALKLGRPFLHRWGKYFFLPQDKLERAEEVFREYGEATTFICRLIPVIRQIISLPAGVAKMNFRRFTFFTAAGAGLWVTFLAVIGFVLGHRTREMTYADLVRTGTELAHKNLPLIILAGAVLIGAYVWVHRWVMRRPTASARPPSEQG
jgi:membrane protein DedA with SNARE-associated domain